jgi:cytosine/adenosine deaminase-related metal-dependent hydrolase
MAGGVIRARDVRPWQPPSLPPNRERSRPLIRECERCGRRHYTFQRCAPHHPEEVDEQEERLLRELAADPDAPWPQDAG